VPAGANDKHVTRLGHLGQYLARLTPDNLGAELDIVRRPAEREVDSAP